MLEDDFRFLDNEDSDDEEEGEWSGGQNGDEWSGEDQNVDTKVLTSYKLGTLSIACGFGRICSGV